MILSSLSAYLLRDHCQLGKDQGSGANHVFFTFWADIIDNRLGCHVAGFDKIEEGICHHIYSERRNHKSTNHHQAIGTPWIVVDTASDVGVEEMRGWRLLM